MVKNPPTNAGDAGSIWAGKICWSPGEIATHSSILAWKSHGQRSLVGYSPQGCKRDGHDLATKQQ